MYIDFQRKVGFLAHPKTGTQTVSSILTENLGFKPVGGHHDGPNNLCSNLMGPWISKWNCLSLKEKDEFSWFCTVRNPYDLVVTWWSGKRLQEAYWDGIDGRCIMEIFSKSPQWYPYSAIGRIFRFLYDPLPGCLDSIVKLENLEEEMRDVLLSYGYKKEDIPRFPHKGRHPYKRRDEPLACFKQNGLNYMARIYGEEIRSLGYEVVEKIECTSTEE